MREERESAINPCFIVVFVWFLGWVGTYTIAHVIHEFKAELEVISDK